MTDASDCPECEGSGCSFGFSPDTCPSLIDPADQTTDDTVVPPEATAAAAKGLRMSDPWIGDENDRAPGACVYGLDESDPNSPICGAAATVHVLSESAMHGEVSLSTCDQHAPIARAAGLFLAEHPFGEGCLAHATWFRADGCVPTDASGPTP